MGKVVEIPSDMTARDLCQLLVYKSHCVDDNSWALVEHHPALGLGKDAREQKCSTNHYTFPSAVVFYFFPLPFPRVVKGILVIPELHNMPFV